MGVLRGLGIVTKDNYGDMRQNTLREQMRQEWAFLLEENRCPVWVSEFGADLSNQAEMRWLRDFTEVLQDLDADWAYWPLNVGPKPECGSNEAYGMLNPDDWSRVSPDQDERLELLSRLGLKSSTPIMSASDSLPTLRVSPSMPEVRKLFREKDPLPSIFPRPAELVQVLAPSRVRHSCDCRVSKSASSPFDLCLGGALDDAVKNHHRNLRAVKTAGGKLCQMVLAESLPEFQEAMSEVVGTQKITFL